MPRTKTEQVLDQEDLERRILRGLALEWQAALWVLSPSHRQLIRPPLFGLRDMKTRWGIWESRNREIALNRDLVLHHSWDSVREVLLHEMAHQFAAEVLGADAEAPHGPRFQEACRLLRANPRAQATRKPLDERVFQKQAGTGDKRLDRVRKLLALAESPDRHEAEAAMAKAHELIARHSLDLPEARAGGREYVTVFAGRPLLRHPAEDYHLANLLQDFYFVRCMWAPAFVLEKERMGRVLEVSGTLQNVRLASYVFDFVRNFIDSQWSVYNRDRKLDRFRRTDFAVGIVRGFRSKIESQQERERSGGRTALVLSKDPLLERHMAYRYPHVATVRRGPSRQDRKVVDAGIRAGKRLILHKGIEDKGRSARLLRGGSWNT